MTEYYKEKFYDEYAIKKEDTIIAIVDSGSNANKIVKCLNVLHEENQQMKSNGLNVLHFYENKLKNSKRKDFQSVRDEIWIVKHVLYEMGVLE